MGFNQYGPPQPNETREQAIDRLAWNAVRFNRKNNRRKSRLCELLFEAFVKDLEDMNVTEDELVRVCPWIEHKEVAEV